ncbi:MAG: DUF2207 domain-containing protein [Proteobacteria bacterium]|nr:DUF2207 domain-containing protein [Pseudomonadota bacterium]
MRAWLAAILIALSLVNPALAQEVMRQFVSDITVNTDGSLDVRERITHDFGSASKRGIIRDIPTRYRDSNGTQVQVGMEVVAVERDGQPEPFAVSNKNNGISIRIGEEDVYLSPGEHTYLIIYRTTRQLGFFENYDELYWNVTGNDWTFPIEQAESIVRLPQGAVIQQQATYTGPMGATGSMARVGEASGNRFVAETTEPLSPGEGFTIAVAWQKGIVTPPSEAQKRLWWISDNLGFMLAGLTLLAAAAYYYFAWLKVGRDPPKGTIIPLFHPPEGLGPAGMRYVWKQGFDNRAFASGVVGLAVKNRLRITDDDGDYSVEHVSDDGPPLTRSETALLQQLPRRQLALTQSNHASVGAARTALRKSLDDEFDGTMFLRNFSWFAIGAAISIIGMLVAGILTPAGEGAAVWFVTLFSSIWWAVVLSVGYATMKGFFAARGFFTRIRMLMGLIFLIPFVGAGIAVPGFMVFGTGLSTATLIFIGVAVALALCNFIFYWLLKAPTVKGRAVLDQIEGFRLYMTTAEEERLKVLHPPEKTPELFQRYLPYAMALDCENEWNAKFAAVLAAAAAAGAAAAPGWYRGRHWNSGSFSRDLGSGLTSSISSAATPPGSSSGSGGGGSSGGGGGGGGGSSW